MAPRNAPSSDHATDLAESQRLDVELEKRRRSAIARILELDPAGPPVAETPAISSVRGRIAELLNGAAPKILFSGKNQASELHALLALELPAITGAIELNRREMSRLGGVHAATVIADKAGEWRSACRDRAFAVAVRSLKSAAAMNYRLSFSVCRRLRSVCSLNRLCS